MRRSVALVALLLSGSAVAAPRPGRTVEIRADRHDVSAPLTLLVASPHDSEEEFEEKGPRPVPHERQAALPARDPVLQDSFASLLMPRTATNFDGIGVGFLGANVKAFDVAGVPPDPQGDVGPAHYVQIVNSSFAVFTKDGHTAFGPVPTRTLFAGFGGPCEGRDDGDGIVLYDPLADRWLVGQFAILRGSDRPYHQCIAVSRSGDPSGQWARYDYPSTEFRDYPKFGVWPDAYYATYNLFASTLGDGFHGIAYCALDRARMLAAEPAVQQCITVHDSVSGLVPADLDGALPPPAGAPNVAVGFNSGGLVLYRFRVSWTNALDSFVENAALAVAPFAEACFSSRNGACIPQAGAGASMLDSLGDRMMFRAAYRNLGGHDALVTNHTVMAGTVTGVRWYEIRDPTGFAILYQQGTYAPDASFRWMASGAMDRAGNIGLGFSISDATMRPSIGYTGRARSDAPGQMGRGESIALTGGGSQASSLRWGDYSSMSIDPADECTFWYTNEYIPFDGVFNWRTRIFSFQLPDCAASADHAVWAAREPHTLGRGRTATIRIDSAALRASAGTRQLALTPRLLPAGISATLDRPAIAPGEAATLTLAAEPDAELGRGQGYAVDAIAADGTSSSAFAALDVVDSDFAITIGAADVRLPTGSDARVNIETRALFGPAETLTFSAVGLRSNVTATFRPNGILAGQSTVLVLGGGADLTASNGSVMVIAESASTSHSALVRLRALGAPHAEISSPDALEALSGNVPVVATAATSTGTTLQRIELLVDGERVPGVFASASPA